MLLLAILACSSAQFFSIESGLYTPEWILDQGLDDLDVYYEHEFESPNEQIICPDGSFHNGDGCPHVNEALQSRHAEISTNVPPTPSAYSSSNARPTPNN